MLDFLSYKFTALTLILAIVAGTLLIFQLVYYFVVYGKTLSVFNKKNKQKTENSSVFDKAKGVSVIIVTNNNGDALRESLLQILEQEYPLFEVVVVNENSTDDTEFILYVLKENYPNLTVINLTENANKYDSYKFSMSIGIRSAKYDYVLLTDVSCAPKTYGWLTQMMYPVNCGGQKNIITGICLREKAKGLADCLEKYDEASSYMNLVAYTAYGNAYTSCGMNMCYNKKFFIDNGGFIPQYSNTCYQEDYFVHRHATAKNTDITVDDNAFLYLPAYSSYKTFSRVKFATSLSRKVLAFKDKILLASLPCASFLFYVTIGLLLILFFPWQYIVPAIVIKWIIQMVYYKKCMVRLNIKKYWIYTPLLEIYFFFFNFIIRIRVLFYRKKQKKIKWD